jgi:hypothetical protein
MSESNPYLRRQDLLQQVRGKFDESEWRLTFLRPIEPNPHLSLTEQEFLKWNQNLPHQDWN